MGNMPAYTHKGSTLRPNREGPYASAIRAAVKGAAGTRDPYTP